MNRKYFVFFMFLLVALFLLGCSETKISTVKNPELYDTKFENILVVVPFTDIGLRRQTEDIFVSRFSSSGMKAISSLETIPPIKEYSDQELMNILYKNKVDGVLVIALKDYWTSKAYVPRSSSTQGSANLYGNSLYYSSYTKEYGGYYVYYPNVSFETRLFDIKSGQVAWLVSSTTSGNAFADYENLASSLAKKVVSELEKEEMLVLKPVERKDRDISSQAKEIATQDINQSPLATFSADPRTGSAPLEVLFDASNSNDPDGNIDSYQWDFKDGNTGNGGKIHHTFKSSGTYQVELTIIDNEGAKATVTKFILVTSSIKE